MTTLLAEYYCETCWFIYDPARGDPEHGIEPGTPFESIPQEWRCPDCGCLALAWSHTHRRGCVYGVTPPQELAYARTVRDPDPPDFRIPQGEDDSA